MTDEVMAQLRSFAAGYLADAVASGVPKLQARRTIVFSQLFGELDRLRAENAALREIAQAVAQLPIHDTWHGNTIELYDCEYFHVFDEDAHALVDRARALLEGARG